LSHNDIQQFFGVCQLNGETLSTLGAGCQNFLGVRVGCHGCQLQTALGLLVTLMTVERHDAPPTQSRRASIPKTRDSFKPLIVQRKG
jgi:hypothetical protein